MMPKLKKLIKNVVYEILPDDTVDFIKTVNVVQKTNRKIIQNKSTVETLLKSRKTINIEFGTWEKRFDGWITVDLDERSDICLDVSLPLPFPDNCVSQIYSSHLLEHLSYPKPMTTFLKECHRILKPEGTIRIAVPNARIYLDAYFNPEEFDFNEYCSYDAGLSYKSRIDYINYMAYMGGHHRHMFDKDSLISVLIDHCFRNVEIREFDPCIDMQEKRTESIYAEGKK
jgi:predicted SAM-dependent methyltransferase